MPDDLSVRQSEAKRFLPTTRAVLITAVCFHNFWQGEGALPSAAIECGNVPAVRHFQCLVILTWKGVCGRKFRLYPPGPIYIRFEKEAGRATISD